MSPAHQLKFLTQTKADFGQSQGVDWLRTWIALALPEDRVVCCP